MKNRVSTTNFVQQDFEPPRGSQTKATTELERQNSNSDISDNTASYSMVGGKKKKKKKKKKKRGLDKSMLSAEGAEPQTQTPTTPITQGSNKSPEPDMDNYQAAFPTQSATQSQAKANTGLGRPLPPSR